MKSYDFMVPESLKAHREREAFQKRMDGISGVLIAAAVICALTLGLAKALGAGSDRPLALENLVEKNMTEAEYRSAVRVFERLAEDPNMDDTGRELALAVVTLAAESWRLARLEGYLSGLEECHELN